MHGYWELCLMDGTPSNASHHSVHWKIFTVNDDDGLASTHADRSAHFIPSEVQGQLLNTKIVGLATCIGPTRYPFSEERHY